jgi:hypothetical protein
MKNLYVFGTGTVVPFLYQKGLDKQIENFESFKANEALSALDTTTNLEGEKTIENVNKNRTPLEDNNQFKVSKKEETKAQSLVAQKIEDFPPAGEGWPPSDEYLTSLDDSNVKAVDNKGMIITDGALAVQTNPEKPNTDTQKSESKEIKTETEEMKNNPVFTDNQGGAEINLTNPTNKISTENLIVQSETLDAANNQNEIISGVTEDNNVTKLT